MKTPILRKIMFVFALLALSASPVFAAKNATAPKAPMLFASPEEAVKNLVEALKASEADKVVNILGVSKALVESDGKEENKPAKEEFLRGYEDYHAIVSNKDDSKTKTLEVGDNHWPFPFPLREDASGKWYFDGKVGEEAIVDRYIGHNELMAMSVCEEYLRAQYEYYDLNPEKNKIKHFAQRIFSEPGKFNGLYWKNKEGEPESPFGPFIAAAEANVNKKGKGTSSYYGYRYKILTSQGPKAKDGAFDYVGKGLMFGGFALLAYPDKYGTTGIMSFMINQDGIIYEKSLGENTAREAAKITSFNPDETWKAVNPSTEDKDGAERTEKSGNNTASNSTAPVYKGELNATAPQRTDSPAGNSNIIYFGNATSGEHTGNLTNSTAK